MSDFKVKIALQKRSQTSPKSIMALQNMKKWTKKLICHFGICPGHCTTDGREYALSLRPIKGAGFWKMSLTKVDNYYAKISFRGMCTVQHLGDISVLLRFPIWDIFFHFLSWVTFFQMKKGANHCHMNNSFQSLLVTLYRLY